jgi:hypothetical protein
LNRVSQPCLGWREWVALPALGIARLECKVDTGARTSALHAFYVEPFKRDGRKWVRFGLHPMAGSEDPEIHCEAPVSDRRVVSDSGGHRTRRYVITTDVVIGTRRHSIEITLTNRDSMRFRMLLGRTALAYGYLVEPSAAHLAGEPAAAPPPAGEA